MEFETQEERHERYWEEDLGRLRELRRSGRLWAARDFALSVLKRRGYHEELSREIAEIFYAMKDYPRAGLYWLTTGDDSEAARECIQWCVADYGKELPDRFRKPLRGAKYPAEIEERIDRSIREAGVEKGIAALEIRGPKEPPVMERAMWIGLCCGLPLLALFFLFSGVYFALRLIF